MPIQGGKAIADVDLGIQGDDTGENISEKNPYYCELTALYWAWKNLKNVDYIGLNHYRRYFKFSPLPFRDYMRLPLGQFISRKDVTFKLNKHLRKYDIILAKPDICSCSKGKTFSNLIYWDDCLLLKETIRKSFPDYYDSFCYLMEHNNKFYKCNMFITRWEIFNDYCKWIFGVLREVEKSIVYKKNCSDMARRALAIMAENIFYVYVFKNNLKVKCYPVIMIEDNEIKRPVWKSMIHCFTANASFLLSQPSKKWFGILKHLWFR
jgi:hypothetical protein